MLVKIIIGKIQRNGKWLPLLLDDPVAEGETKAPFFKYGQPVMKVVAKLSKKEAGRARVKTWSIAINHRANLAGEEIRKAAQAQAERWAKKILCPEKEVAMPREVALLEVGPSFDPATDLLK